MKINIISVVFSGLCLIACVSALTRVSVVDMPIDQHEFVAALRGVGKNSETVGLPRDASVFLVDLPHCNEPGNLFIGSIAARNLFDQYAKAYTNNAKIQRLYLGRDMPGFSSKFFWPIYILHEVLSKLGLQPNSFWSQKFVALELPNSCGNVVLVWDGIRSPTFKEL